jgi:hypothetical protein
MAAIADIPSPTPIGPAPETMESVRQSDITPLVATYIERVPAETKAPPVISTSRASGSATKPTIVHSADRVLPRQRRVAVVDRRPSPAARGCATMLCSRYVLVGVGF